MLIFVAELSIGNTKSVSELVIWYSSHLAGIKVIYVVDTYFHVQKWIDPDTQLQTVSELTMIKCTFTNLNVPCDHWNLDVV